MIPFIGIGLVHDDTKGLDWTLVAIVWHSTYIVLLINLVVWVSA